MSFLDEMEVFCHYGLGFFFFSFSFFFYLITFGLFLFLLEFVQYSGYYVAKIGHLGVVCGTLGLPD